MIGAMETMVLDSGNIIKCKQLTKQVFESLADEMVESTRHCLASLEKSAANSSSPIVEYTHENHSSVVTSEDQDQVRVCLKVFLSQVQEENALIQAVHKAMSQLGVSRIDSLILSFPSAHKIELQHMQPAWKVCEQLIAQGLVCTAGTSDLDISQLRELYQWAPLVKPTTNQIHFESPFALSADMAQFASDHNIQLLSHADDALGGTVGPANVRKILSGFKDDAEEWNCAWVSRYTLMFRCRGVLHSKGYIVKLEKNKSLRSTPQE